MIIYLAIFMCKIIENALSTLRLIVVSNGKKKLGALLQGIVTLIWIISISIVIIDINKDIFKIIAFCLGSLVGSYLGSIIEEKIALGNNLLICISNKEYKNIIIKRFKCDYIESNNKIIFFLCIKRKDIIKTTNLIKKIDINSNIISTKAHNTF